MNMIKVIWCRFWQCLVALTILLVEASSEARLFRHLSNHIFGVRNIGTGKAVRVIFFLKMLKIQSRFQKWSRKLRETFYCLDNWIWIVSVKLSLLRGGFFSPAANVLTSSPKICHVNKRNFFEQNFLPSDKWIW